MFQETCDWEPADNSGEFRLQYQAFKQYPTGSCPATVPEITVSHCHTACGSRAHVSPGTALNRADCHPWALVALSLRGLRCGRETQVSACPPQRPSPQERKTHRHHEDTRARQGSSGQKTLPPWGEVPSGIHPDRGPEPRQAQPRFALLRPLTVGWLLDQGACPSGTDAQSHGSGSRQPVVQNPAHDTATLAIESRMIVDDKTEFAF